MESVICQEVCDSKKKCVQKLEFHDKTVAIWQTNMMYKSSSKTKIWSKEKKSSMETEHGPSSIWSDSTMPTMLNSTMYSSNGMTIDYMHPSSPTINIMKSQKTKTRSMRERNEQTKVMKEIITEPTLFIYIWRLVPVVNMKTIFLHIDTVELQIMVFKDNFG